MTDEMAGRTPAGFVGEDQSASRAAALLAVMNELPTLQRNALRKVFNRPEFSPQEVAALGFRRLYQAEGIGSKGLVAIGRWLERHGLALPQPEGSGPSRSKAPRVRRSIESAVRLLRTHGYIVQDGEGASEAGQEAHGRS